jgi:hypothetical protein
MTWRPLYAICIKSAHQTYNDDKHTKYHIKVSCSLFAKQLLKALEFVIVDEETPSKISTAEGENFAENHKDFCHGMLSFLVSIFSTILARNILN